MKRENIKNKELLLQETRQKIMKGFEKWVEKEMGSPFYFDDEVIFHYTNAAGLKGIIENNCLWATNLSYVNDSKELTLGLSIYREVCEKLMKRKNKSKAYHNILKKFFDCLSKKNLSNRYACCFTCNGDQLGQWRGYASNGQGYAIGFETRKLIGNLAPDAEPSRIIYDIDTQRIYAEKHVDSLIKGFIELLRKKHKPLSAYTNTILRILEQESEFTILGFKHKGFEEETENRLHLAYSDLETTRMLEKNGILIPYVELKTKNGKKLPIKQITIGPTIDFDRAEKGVRFLLERYGYRNVKVLRSQIPFKL
jgi:hypothetical protein